MSVTPTIFCLKKLKLRILNDLYTQFHNELMAEPESPRHEKVRVVRDNPLKCRLSNGLI